MPNDFLAYKDKYAEQQAVVFEGLDYFSIWLLLMMKRYDVLAEHFVNIGNVFKSDEEIVNFLKSRTRRI